MITKEKLMTHLGEALKTEENAIPLYSKHIGSTLFFSPFEEEKRKRIQEILNKLIYDSQRHARMIEDLIDKLKNGDKDVY